MSVLLERKLLTVEPHESFITFERDHPTGWANRYLKFWNEQAYHTGYWCDTCQFAFEQLEGVRHWVSPREISAELSQGLTALQGSFIQSASLLLPGGDYLACLFELTPVRVRLGGHRDYFANEGARLWGMEFGLAHDPKIEYYRTASLEIGSREFPNDKFFEFVVPMFGGANPKALSDYAARLLSGARPTALAVCLLDAKTAYTPPDRLAMDWIRSAWPHVPRWAEETHLCLSHYLLDGHHKVFAASLVARPVTLLSFLSLDHSFANRQTVDVVLDSLKQT